MSKSILIVDTPKCCFDCDLWDDDKHCFRCIVAGKKYEDNSIVQEWCPLRPMPVHHYSASSDLYAKGHVNGYNDCIDELMEGTK